MHVHAFRPTPRSILLFDTRVVWRREPNSIAAAVAAAVAVAAAIITQQLEKHRVRDSGSIYATQSRLWCVAGIFCFIAQY